MNIKFYQSIITCPPYKKILALPLIPTAKIDYPWYINMLEYIELLFINLDFHILLLVGHWFYCLIK